ncbi:hypothetical protein PG991_010869 [Apiospora marii]|uniref:Uncharacterized protein n=1 Tax=Apiospora marii TaxID=335849 RepID=A0ABR1RCH4_9PEZI
MLETFIVKTDPGEEFRCTGVVTGRESSICHDIIARVDASLRDGEPWLDGTAISLQAPISTKYLVSRSRQNSIRACVGSTASSETSSSASTRFTSTDIDPVPIYHDTPASASNSNRFSTSTARWGGKCDYDGNATRNNIYDDTRDILSEDRVSDEEMLYSLGYLAGSCRGIRCLGLNETRDKAAGNSTGAADTQATISSQFTATSTGSPSNFTSSSSSSSPIRSRAHNKRRVPRDSPDVEDRPCPKTIKHSADKRDWEECKDVFADASICRQREDAEWLKAQTACYHRIWRVVFPASYFPISCMRPPGKPSMGPSVNNYISSSIRSTLDQVKVLFCALQHVDASRAVGGNTKRNLEQAFATVTDLSEENREYLETVREACTTAAVHDWFQWVNNEMEGSHTSSASSNGSHSLELQKPLISMKTSSIKQAVWFVENLPTNPDYRPDNELNISVVSADNNTQPEVPTTTIINSGERHGEPVAADSVISPTALMEMPLIDPSAVLPFDSGETAAAPHSSSMQDFNHNASAKFSHVEEVSGFADGVMTTLGTDPWLNDSQNVVENQYTYDNQTAPFLDWTVVAPVEEA